MITSTSVPRIAKKVLSGGHTVESLEPRTLLAFGPIGPEFLVNTVTPNTQHNSAVAVGADGHFVVVWNSDLQDGSSFGIYGQQYDAAGDPIGGEFRINTTTVGDQTLPAIAMDADGDFVVIWESYQQDRSFWGIYGQRYNADAEPQGGEYRVNTFTSGNQADPSVAMDADGDFVVSWWSWQDGSRAGVQAQRYGADGEPAGGEFRVNTFTEGDQGHASLAMDDDGSFVAAWESIGQDGSGGGIYGQAYDATGQRVGGEFRVSTTTAGNQYSIVRGLGMDDEGDYVVVWQGNGAGDTAGVFARCFSASGQATGDEFRVNVVTAGEQKWPSVAVDGGGEFIVTWNSAGQDGSGTGVYARRFKPSGEPLGGEFLVNTFTAGAQEYPMVAANPTGDFVITWNSDGQDGFGWGIYAQRYGTSAAPRVSQVFVNGPGLTGGTPSADAAQFRVLAGIDATFGYPVPAGTGQTRPLPWIGGINSVSIRFDQDMAGLVEAGDLEVRGVATASHALSGFSYDSSTRTATWALGSTVTNDALRLFIGDVLVPVLDGEWRTGYPSGDGTAGGDFDLPFNALAGDATGDRRVNATDLADVRRRLNRTATNPRTGSGAYSPFADVNADGRINALDLAAVKQRLNTRLPDPAPAGGPAVGAARLDRRSAANDLLFSTQPIL